MLSFWLTIRNLLLWMQYFFNLPNLLRTVTQCWKCLLLRGLLHTVMTVWVVDFRSAARFFFHGQNCWLLNRWKNGELAVIYFLKVCCNFFYHYFSNNNGWRWKNCFCPRLMPKSSVGWTSDDVTDSRRNRLPLRNSAQFSRSVPGAYCIIKLTV